MNLENLYNFNYRIGDVVQLIDRRYYTVTDFDVKNLNNITTKLDEKIESFTTHINNVISIVETSNLKMSNYINRYVLCLKDNAYSVTSLKKGMIGKIVSNNKIEFPIKDSLDYSYSCALIKDYRYLFMLLPSNYNPNDVKTENKTNNNFIVGNWYKTTNTEKPYYAKFLKWNKDFLVSSEMFVHNNYYEINYEFCVWNWVPATLEEIQFFLPDEHPDKFDVVTKPPIEPKKSINFEELDLDEWLIETKKLNLSFDKLENHINSPKTCNYDKVYEKLKGFNPHEKAKILFDEWNTKFKYEKDKWYIFNNPNFNGFCAAKFKELSDCGKYFRFFEYIGNNKHKYYNGSWFENKCTKELVDITNSEFQELLPDNHELKMAFLIKYEPFKTTTKNSNQIEIVNHYPITINESYLKSKMSKDISIVDVSNFQFKRKKRKSIINL